METARRQSAALAGLSRFLLEHEACGGGFDVASPAGPGSGRISLACRRCGATHGYATATIELEREIELEPLLREPAAAPPPEPPPLSGPVRSNGRGGRPRAGGRGRDRAIAAGLLALSIAALAFAVIRLSGDTGESPTAAPSTAPQPARLPRATRPPAAPAAKPPARPVARWKLVRAPRFSLRVPAGWTQRSAGGGLLLAPRGRAAVSIQVFYESNAAMTQPAMSSKTAEFLRSRAPNGAIAGPRSLRLGNHRAFELRDRGPAGVTTALGVLAGPYRYLAVETARTDAPASPRAAAARALRSFRPR